MLPKKKPWKPFKRGETAGWRQVGGMLFYFRSRWEANFGKYLEWIKSKGDNKDWKHEPKFFEFLEVKHGIRRYLPDFEVIEANGTSTWVEVKGYLSDKDKTKIKRFQKYYPTERLMVIDGNWFARNNPLLRNLVPGWE
jgi:hypothetical protein